MSSDRDDFPALRPITTRPVALNLAAWDVESASGVEEPSCYLCHVTADDPDATPLRNAGLPQSDLWVCRQCDGSWQHQTDQREAWLAEESRV